MKRHILLLAVLVALVAASCETTSRVSQYPKMYQEHPLTILVMPPINNTTNVEAKELLFSSINKPLAEAGYYVISPLLSLDLMKNESAYDAELFIDQPLGKFKEVFGADAVLFTTINTWAKQGFGIHTDLHYIIKSTTTNEILFERNCDLYLDLSSHTSSNNKDNNNSWVALVADLAVSTINTLMTDHIEAARKANEYVFRDMPRGKYHEKYNQDQEDDTDRRNITVTVR